MATDAFKRMPIPDNFHVQICDWANGADRQALMAVRETVFVVEQRVPADLERDRDDEAAVHALAMSLDGTPIGTGRLTVSSPAYAADVATTNPHAGVQDDPGALGATRSSGRIGRMAVLRDWRQRGVGSMILHTLVDLARTRQIEELTLHAQRDAVEFYQGHGFTVEGAEFEEAGITHVLMRRTLAALAAPQRPPPPPAPQPLALQCSSREELINVTQTLLSGAEHSMCVLVRELHPLLLNDTACMVELRRLAISGRGASIRILAQDLTRAMDEGSRLLELAQRLSSVVEMRRPVEPADLQYPSAFMCVDTGGYLFRPRERDMAATGSTRAPGRHMQLMGLFEAVWARSEPWPELRVLRI